MTFLISILGTAFGCPIKLLMQAAMSCLKPRNCDSYRLCDLHGLPMVKSIDLSRNVGRNKNQAAGKRAKWEIIN